MTEQQLQREIKSGWFRTVVTTAVGIVALATSTYTVVAKIASFEVKVAQNEKHIAENDMRLKELESSRLPDGLERGQLQAALKAVQDSLDKIERRLERMEQIRR